MKKNGLIILAAIAGIGYLLYKAGLFSGESSFWGGGSGGTAEPLPLIPTPAPLPAIVKEPIPQPIQTTIQAYNQLPLENRLQSGSFNFAPYTQSGNLTVFPIVTQSLVQQGVTQKYVPITQLGLPQTQMLMTLSQKLTPSVTYSTGAGVRLPAPSLYQVLNPTPAPVPAPLPSPSQLIFPSPIKTMLPSVTAPTTTVKPTTTTTITKLPISTPQVLLNLSSTLQTKPAPVPYVTFGRR